MMTFTLQNDCVYLNTINLMMIIGAFKQELHQRQQIEVSVAIELNLLKHLEKDDLEQSYDYSRAYRLIHELSSSPYVLVEYFAQTIAERLLSTEERINAVEVIIAKKGAFVDVDRVGCRISRRRT
jgi:FolB domain-containing protein